jgi:hypothetical protein
VDNGDIPLEIDTSRPYSARMYDYFLGGKDNFAADRETANKALGAWPAMRTAARVVYVDNDPIVLAHGRALLRSKPQGRSVYIEADMREPEKILAHPLVPPGVVVVSEWRPGPHAFLPPRGDVSNNGAVARKP